MNPSRTSISIADFSPRSDAEARAGRYRVAPSEAALERLERLLPLGRENAISTADLAFTLGISKRQVQEAVAELIGRGVAVGSGCGETPGFFRMRPGDDEDFEHGTRHIRRRAASMFRRIRALEKIRQREYPAAVPLFDLDRERVSV